MSSPIVLKYKQSEFFLKYASNNTLWPIRPSP
ncbi:hypothetical protein CHELA20_40004 [Hyphomicrobiales bacterium]|nr:hypothetical protein CHELA20_40004 [Hyphomicrobiales bacterium]CAH1687391.1 hypothetical protein CHELA41_40004 [Hyphomicrobiales bacterium]